MTHATPPSLNPPRHGAVFALVFLALFTVLHAAYSYARDTSVERGLIDVATVKPSAALINLITPDEGVQAQGHRLVSPHARLSVLNGCEGTECMMLLIAAVLATRAPWRHTLAGVVLGVALVYACNQVRIVGLFYAFRHHRAWFEILHGYVAPAFVIAVACLFFLAWVNRVATGDSRDGVAPAR